VTVLQLLLGALTIATNYFFVSGEFALISVRRSQIEAIAESGDHRARTVIWGLEHVSAVLATTQLGITISSLILGAVAEPAIAQLLTAPFEAVGMPERLVHPVSLVIALGTATYLHMLVGEMVPKNLALAAPEQTAFRFVPPLVAITRALRPVASAINAVANGMLRLLHVEPKDEVNSVFTDEELARMVQEAADHELLDERRTELLHDALHLVHRKLCDVVTPLKDVVFASPDTTPAQLEQLATSSRFSRFPIRNADDTVTHYLHIKDVLGHDTARDRPLPNSARRAIARISADAPLDDALTAMRRSRTHLAAAITTDGTTTGVATMADILQQLIGSNQT
jgi:magnesium and cobalt exporter, CNNM family